MCTHKNPKTPLNGPIGAVAVILLSVSMLAFTAVFPAHASQAESCEIHITTAFDDSGSMDQYVVDVRQLNKRQLNLAAWAIAVESPEFAAAIHTVGKGGCIWFDAFYWSKTILPLIPPTKIAADDPLPALRQIASILREESMIRKPRLNGTTLTSLAMGYGIQTLLDTENHPAFRRVLNIVTDDTDQETDIPDILRGLQQLAKNNDITINALIIGNTEAHDHYFHEYVKTGKAAFVYSTSDFPSIEIAWRRKFLADIG